MASILITGGAGFIGSNIAEALCKEHDITVLDNLSTGKPENIPKSKRIKFIKADVCDPAAVRGSLKGIDYVIHLAALLSVPRSIKDPVNTDRINTGGTLNMLFESSRAEVKRFVYASSSSVYGNTKKLPDDEGMNPDPLSPYAASKVAGEYYCSVFARSFGLSAVSLRYFNVFGPRQDPSSEYSAVVPKFIAQMMKGERPVICGNGEQTRDFTYVKDIVLANSLVMESKKGAGEVFNIATGKKQSLNQLVAELNRLLGTKIKPAYLEPRTGDIMHSVADITRANKAFDYEPKWSFEQGLKETLEWYSK